MATRFFPRIGWALLLGAVLFTPATGRAGVTVTILGPTVQATNVANANTETFNELTLGDHTAFAFAGNPSFGVFLSPGIAIQNADQYGGANGSQYAAVGAESNTSSATLMLSGLQGYLGVYWSAGDAGNELQLYNNGVLVFDYSTAKVLDFLSTLPGSSSYFGNPSSSNLGQDASEPFAYLNFFATSDSQFNKVVFIQNGGGGFEFDNVSIAGVQQGTSGTLVSPEPGSVIIWSLLGASGFLAARRRRNA